MKASKKLTSVQIDKNVINSNHNQLNKLKQLTYISDSNLLATYSNDFFNIFYLNHEKLKLLTCKRIYDNPSVVQLGYLKLSKQVILLPEHLIMNISLNCINNCKFLQKYDHKLYPQANILLSKDENLLFVSKFHSICILKNNNSSWECTEELDQGSIILFVKQQKLNKTEDKLICYLISGSIFNYLIVYIKKQNKNIPLWREQQWIEVDQMGQLLDFFDDQIFYLNSNNNLEIFSQDQKLNKFQKIQIYQEDCLKRSIFQNSYIFYNYNKTFLIKQNELSVLQFDKEGAFVEIKLIAFDQKEFSIKNEIINSIQGALSDDGQYLVLWNKEITHLKYLINII